MLDSLYIDNYKCYSNFRWENIPSTVFLGGINGAGKSTIFEVLALLRDVCGRGASLIDDDGSYKLMGKTTTRWMSVPEQSFELCVKGNGGVYKFKLIVDCRNGNNEAPRIKAEELSFDNALIFSFIEGEVSLYNDSFEKKVSFHADWSRSFLANTAERSENKRVIWFLKWLRNILVIKANPWVMANVANKEVDYPSENLVDFSCWLRYIKQSCDDDVYADYIDELKLVIDGFRGIRLDSVGENAKEIKIVIANGLKSEYTIKELSEGQRLLIALYAIFYFLNKNSTLICLDEPDNFLALREVSPLIGKLMDSAENSAQFMTTSHHSEFFNRCALDSGFLLQRASGRQTVIAAISKVLGQDDDMKLSVAEIFSRGWESV